MNERHQLRGQDEVPDEVATEDQIQAVGSQLGVTDASHDPGFLSSTVGLQAKKIRRLRVVSRHSAQQNNPNDCTAQQCVHAVGLRWRMQRKN